jgi:hypothetical protein
LLGLEDGSDGTSGDNGRLTSRGLVEKFHAPRACIHSFQDCSKNIILRRKETVDKLEISVATRLNTRAPHYLLRAVSLEITTVRWSGSSSRGGRSGGRGIVWIKGAV